MKKILITGASDGIGRLAAQMLAQKGHDLLIHGRSKEKLEKLAAELKPHGAGVEIWQADLSRMAQVEQMASNIQAHHDHLDVLINNAGVLKAPNPVSEDGLDIRFAVNTIAPYVLTRRLLGLFTSQGRIINVTSAAQAPVSLAALKGEETGLNDMAAYSQSKQATTQWTQHLVHSLGQDAPLLMTLNPGSLLGTKMVKEGFNMEGKDIRIGGEIITRLALDPSFEKARGRYFDNDSGSFGPLPAAAIDRAQCKEIVDTLDSLIA